MFFLSGYVSLFGLEGPAGQTKIKNAIYRFFSLSGFGPGWGGTWADRSVQGLGWGRGETRQKKKKHHMAFFFCLVLGRAGGGGRGWDGENCKENNGKL